MILREWKVIVHIIDMTQLSDGTIQKKVLKCLLAWDFLEEEHHFVTVLYCGRVTMIGGVR